MKTLHVTAFLDNGERCCTACRTRTIESAYALADSRKAQSIIIHRYRGIILERAHKDEVGNWIPTVYEQVGKHYTKGGILK